MKRFLAYTGEGITEDGKGNAVENFQILDWIDAPDAASAAYQAVLEMEAGRIEGKGWVRRIYIVELADSYRLWQFQASVEDIKTANDVAV